jgi:hypothetical protein
MCFGSVDGFEFFDLSDLMARGFERKGRIKNGFYPPQSGLSVQIRVLSNNPEYNAAKNLNLNQPPLPFLKKYHTRNCNASFRDHDREKHACGSQFPYISQ